MKFWNANRKVTDQIQFRTISYLIIDVGDRMEGDHQTAVRHRPRLSERQLMHTQTLNAHLQQKRSAKTMSKKKTIHFDK